jgi:hypothetical protein
MRGWVCCLQLLLALTRAVILGSKSCGTHDHILLSQIQHFPNLEGQVPVFISQGTGWPSYTPRHWVPFSWPPTTHREVVEVFELASICGNSSNVKVKVRVTLQLAVYHQSVCLGVKPLETCDQRFLFFN